MGRIREKYNEYKRRYGARRGSGLFSSSPEKSAGNPKVFLYTVTDTAVHPDYQDFEFPLAGLETNEEAYEWMREHYPEPRFKFHLKRVEEISSPKKSEGGNPEVIATKEQRLRFDDEMEAKGWHYVGDFMSLRTAIKKADDDEKTGLFETTIHEIDFPTKAWVLFRRSKTSPEKLESGTITIYERETLRAIGLSMENAISALEREDFTTATSYATTARHAYESLPPESRFRFEHDYAVLYSWMRTPSTDWIKEYLPFAKRQVEGLKEVVKIPLPGMTASREQLFASKTAAETYAKTKMAEGCSGNITYKNGLWAVDCR